MKATTMNRTKIAALRLAAVAALALASAGCVSLGAKPPPVLLNLTSAKSAAAGSALTSRAGDALVVFDPDTDQRLAAMRVPVQVDDATVAYLKDAVWVERPARLFGSLLAETLRASGRRLVLSASETESPGAERLSGRLLDMGYDARQQAVIVRFDAILTSREGTIRTQRFESVVSGVEAKAEAVAPALNEAANDVAAQVAAWVG